MWLYYLEEKLCLDYLLVINYFSMALTQKYGIMYPFQLDNNEELFLDLNTTHKDMVKSKVLHVLFTQKGQKIRDPEFGTNLIKFIFEPSDSITFEDLKLQLREDIKKQVPEVEFDSITIADDENDEHSKIVIVHYSTMGPNGPEMTSTAVKI